MEGPPKPPSSVGRSGDDGREPTASETPNISARETSAGVPGQPEDRRQVSTVPDNGLQLPRKTEKPQGDLVPTHSVSS